MKRKNRVKITLIKDTLGIILVKRSRKAELSLVNLA